jgi:hypothetical protein
MNIGTVSISFSCDMSIWRIRSMNIVVLDTLKIVYALDCHIMKFMFNYSSRINERKVKTKVVTVRTTKVYRGSGNTTPLVLNLCNRWRWVINITPRLFYAWERTTVLTGLEAGWVPEKYIATSGIRTPDRPVRSLVTIPTTISRLQNR